MLKRGILTESSIDPAFLKLEITESVVMDDFETAAAMLSQLRALGVRLSIDDFGTGYSSLSYLHALPLDQVMAACGSVQIKAAARLGITRQTLARRLGGPEEG